MIELRTIPYKYSDDEMNAVRETFSENQIRLEEVKEEKARVSKEYSEQIKLKQKELKSLRENIKTKGEDRQIEVEGIANYGNGMMEYWAASGHLKGQIVDSRRLLPAEKQMRLDSDETTITLRKAASH